ncbi:MAG: dTDP-4-dehydrorhamnose 3,5-epimerase [Caldilinea sp.]|uniref:dTDP-4-dehydrorhamnose 3,5-epimerase family protein n=1 Tax=Caldilinea sp. TaxID=2293560 RepID=UPI002CE390C8|nr:dTDP-4-dehydrorhamnose 3,5-epimerase [Caldilinea sp.]HRA68237.1 dTDP-4-dehydrorhamnose 3,5-epimerase [Caldilinea sp.]
MTEIIESSHIVGVRFARLKAFGDDRGRFLETFRKDWFPERTWEIVQTNRSDSRAGVLRGLHYHFHQVDYWYVPRGRVRVGLADLRRASPTFGASEVIEIGDHNDTGIFIPTGVAHGFYALTDATLTYLVDNYYDGSDEFGVAWDDPTLAVAWGVTEPILSGRDRANPRLADIPVAQQP